MYQWLLLEVVATRFSDFFFVGVLFGLLWVFPQEIVDVFEYYLLVPHMSYEQPFTATLEVLIQILALNKLAVNHTSTFVQLNFGIIAENINWNFDYENCWQSLVMWSRFYSVCDRLLMDISTDSGEDPGLPVNIQVKLC